ncbi:MAG: family 16 glycosylhydrolase [Haliscomenobacter sp.]
MKIYLFLFFPLLLLTTLSAQKRGTLVWSDEFNYEGLPDSTRWGYDVGDGCPRVCGWGNNEQQFYTEKNLRNARVENGSLVIEAHQEPTGGKPYSSARLVTRGKQTWTYGRIEIRAKLPAGKGTWPAAWMLPEVWSYGEWPACGEIDIMEYVGYAPDSLFGTVHTQAFNHLNGTQKGARVQWPTPLENVFHIYSIDWTPDYISFLCDDTPYFRFDRMPGSDYKSWPFDQPFHLILNLAVGGNWAGSRGIDTDIWPRRMEVDYVRVYQHKKRKP